MFTRKGDNFEVEVPLTIPEALGGAEIEVPTLNGRKKLRVKPGTGTGPCSACAARGRRELGGGRGDLHYRFVIDVPEKLNKEQKAAVAQLSEGDERRPARAPVRGGGRGRRAEVTRDGRPRARPRAGVRCPSTSTPTAACS